ncbi:peptidylprolyl isomerase [Polymorphobacter fuscus]|nr:peptidylprolyl isomerase [Polymorphobacter fuscus]NJC07371.1 peptidyl-prolyl cis-trans isomerase D [Polymorphobacter fuscus]
MITFIRKWLTSWPVIIMLGFLLVAFAVTGIGDPLGSGAPTGSVAKVGGRTISEPELAGAFDRAIRNARETNPALTQAQAAREGGVAAVAGQLIGQTAIEEFARDAGLVASDRAIGAVIAGIPAFQVGGKFDDATYRRILGEQRMSDRELRTSIAGDILRKQLLTPVTGALGVPAGMAEPYARLMVDTHRGAVAMVPLAATAPPTDAEVAAYYDANKLRFTVPERRSFRYAFIDRDSIAAGVKVSDADIAAAFARDPAKFGAAATRKLQQVVVPDEAKAKAIAAAAATEGFAKAAERLAGFGAEDIALGEQNQAAFGKATSAEVAAAAFAAPVGGITAPIKTAFGWHVVRVEAEGASGKTLAQARPAVEAELRTRAIETAVADVVARIEDGADAGKSFADLARETGLTIVTQAPVTVAGMAPGAPPLTGPPLAVAAKAFRHEPGEAAAVEDLGDGRLVVIETMNIVPMAAQPLTAVRAAAVEGATRDKAMRAARAKADAIVAATKKNGDFKAAVLAQGLAAPQPLSGRRVDVAGQPQVPPIIQAFLATPAGTVRVEPSPAGWVLINVDAIEPGKIADTPGLLDASRRDIASALPEEFSRAFAAATERAVGVKRNDGVIAATTRRLSGQDSGQ